MGGAHHETRLLTGDDQGRRSSRKHLEYDSYVEALETEAFEALQAYARIFERIIQEASKPTKWLGCAVVARPSWRVPFSRNTRPISRN